MKPIRRIWLIISAIAAFGLAAIVFYYAYITYDQLVATTPVVVTARPIEPYTIVTPDHLELKDMPRAILEENIYVSVADITGRIATSRIPAGSLIYKSLVVAPSQFRYTDDPNLEVVSIPVDPARAVGGQIRVGHIVSIYRAARASKILEASDPLAILSQQGAAVELLTSAPVVDVRSGRGGDVEQRTAPSDMEEDAQTNRGSALEIVTLAVSPEITGDLIRLAVEQHTNYELWLSLAPADRGSTAVSSAESGSQ
jgi:Flp pilus assembly protein CpaB